jgi:hypothetical protein
MMVATYGEHKFGMEVKNALASNCMKEVCIFYPAWQAKHCTSSQQFLVSGLSSHVQR